MIFAIKNKEKLKDLEEIDDLRSKVKQDKLVDELGKQGYFYDKAELFELITKTLTASIQKLLEETKSSRKAILNLDESNK